MSAFGRLNRLMLGSLAVACVAALGCRDESTGPRMVPTPSGPMRDLGTMIVHVDLKHHRITTEPMSSSTQLPPGVSARFFGNSAEIEYAPHEGRRTSLRWYAMFNTAFHAGFSNLLTFAIGTNSPHAYPARAAGHDGHVRVLRDSSRMTSSARAARAQPASARSLSTALMAYIRSRRVHRRSMCTGNRFWREAARTRTDRDPSRRIQTATPAACYFRRMSFHTHGSRHGLLVRCRHGCTVGRAQRGALEGVLHGDSFPIALAAISQICSRSPTGACSAPAAAPRPFRLPAASPAATRARCRS